MRLQNPEATIECLKDYLTERRSERIEAVIQERTNTVVTVIEGLSNTGNVNAVMRSAEALGFHQFHIIENNAHFKHSERTSSGAEKWLHLHSWPTPEACIRHLHERNYNVVVTHLDDTSIPIEEIDFTKPTALVFGNEQHGVTEGMLCEADQRCIIPMGGFVQSFNISVAAAIGLYHAYKDRLTRQGFHGDLSEPELIALRAEYYYKSIKQAERLLRAKEEN